MHTRKGEEKAVKVRTFVLLGAFTLGVGWVFYETWPEIQREIKIWRM